MIRAAAIFTALGFVMPHKAEIGQRVQVGIALQIDRAAIAAVAAVRPALRDVFFAPESDDAVAAISGFDFDFGFIDEFHGALLRLGHQAEKPRSVRGLAFWH